MTDDDPTRPLALVRAPRASELSLHAFGSVPWSLRGAYVTFRPQLGREGARYVEVRAVRFRSDRRVTYHERRLSFEQSGLAMAGAEPARARDLEAAEVHRRLCELVVNVPRYGWFALDPELATLALRRTLPGQRALFDAVASARGASAARLTVGPSKLVIQLGSGVEHALEPALPALDIRQFALAAGHIAAIAWSPLGADSGAGQLGIAPLFGAEGRAFRWFPIELAPAHQLFGAVRRGPWLWVSIADRRDARVSRIRSLGVHLEHAELRVGASYEIEAHGPFAVEFVGAEPVCLYGLGTRPEHAERSALSRLDLRSGKSSMSHGAFGIRLGAPAIAREEREWPRAGRPWLLVPTYDAVRDRADLTIREGSEPERTPVAFVRLPTGFALSAHGVWI